jgi:hypothetical protein
MLCNGYEGFSSVCPRASRLVLNVVETAWPRTTGSLHTRLADVFRVAREAVCTLEAEEEPFAPPAASLLVVAHTGRTACAAWVGWDIAMHIRGARISGTTPHTLEDEYRARHGVDAPIPNGFKNIVGRLLGPSGTKDSRPPSLLTFALEADDKLVLMTHPTLERSRVVKEAAAHADPATLSRRLAEHAFKERKFFSAVAVLRFDESGSPYR